MRLKTGLYIFCCAILISLTSCLGDSNSEESIIPNDAELLSFGLSHDSIPSLATMAFSIDQVNGWIFNHDSLPFQTVISKPVIVKYTNSLNRTNVLLRKADGDSVWVASGDSLNVSQPVSLEVFSVDRSKIKIYRLWINIHQIDPDSVQYHRWTENQDFLKNTNTKAIAYKGRYYLYVRENAGITIYQSDNAKDWTAMHHDASIPDNLDVSSIQSCELGVFGRTESGDFYFSDNALTNWQKKTTPAPIRAVLGFLPESSTQSHGFAFVVENTNKELKFAFLNFSTGEWTEGKDDVNKDFPLSGFSIINEDVLYDKQIAVIGGINALGEIVDIAWRTDNGFHWVNLSEGISAERRIPLLKGANVFLYNGEYLLMNGKFTTGDFNEKVYFSIDKGRTWSAKPEKYQAPKAYSLRLNASLVIDGDEKNFYIIGGENKIPLTDIWQVFLNKKTFAN